MRFTPFDASEFLNSEEAIAEYLAVAVAVAVAVADPDPELFIAALGDVAKALSPGSKLRYETVRKIMDVLGVKLTVATGSS